MLYGTKLPRKSVVPSTGICGPHKDCFINARVPWEELGANHTWSYNAGVHREVLIWVKKASWKLSKEVGRMVS